MLFFIDLNQHHAKHYRKVPVYASLLGLPRAQAKIGKRIISGNIDQFKIAIAKQ